MDPVKETFTHYIMNNILTPDLLSLKKLVKSTVFCRKAS